jgi:hypothetical protein
MTVLRRIGPALLLLVLAPLTAEFLLGDFSIRRLPLLLVFLPQYGGGALLIREVTRWTRRGWPTMVLLGTAYALIEEGVTTQSLFNPNYLGLRLLDYGYMPALGISTVWTVFVLSIHVVWSICTPILIVEGVAGVRRTTPWLGRFGLAITAMLFVIGCAFIAVFTIKSNGFVASPMHFAVVSLLALAVIVAAFSTFRPESGEVVRPGGAPAPSRWVVVLTTFVLASTFELIMHNGARLGVPPTLTALAMVACEIMVAVLIVNWSSRDGWTPNHYLAIATGAVLTYSWVGLSRFLKGTTNIGEPTTRVDDIGQVIEILVILSLIAWTMTHRRLAPGDRGPSFSHQA